MSSTPNKRLHENGGNGSGNASHDQSSASKYSHDDQGTKSGNSGKVVAPIRHDHHSPYEMGQDRRIPKIVARNDSRDEERRSPLLPNMMFRVSTSNDAHSDHIGSKDSIKVDNRDLKSDSRDDTRDGKHERDSYSEHKSEKKLDKDVYSGSNSQFGRKDMKEHQRSKQNSEGPGGNVDTWHTSRTILQGPTEVVKEGLHSDIRDHSESARENKVDMKGDDKLGEKERKGKEMKHRDWAERDKERSDPRNNSLVGGGGSGENKEVQRESEKGGFEKKDPVKDKEKLHEKEKVHTKRESDKDTMQNEKELVGVPGKSAELKISMLDLKKKDHDKNAEREARDKKKERDADVESERPDKRGRFHEKEPEDCGMESEGGVEREIETFKSGVQQRKRMLRPRGSPQRGNRDLRIRPHSNDNEGSQGQADASCVVYKNRECMQELIKLWKKQEQSLADEACESLPNGPTLEIRIPAEHVTATNRQVRGGQLWGTDVYTVDSDLVAVLTHTGYYRPTASPPPPNTQELRATIRVLPPQDGYVSTWRNNVRSRAWGAAVGCSYCVERCCIVKKGGGIVEIEPCLTHSSTMEPTLAPVAVECTMTTRAAATNALHKRRFVREVTIQFNLCNEPWIKYSISAVADKGLKRPLFTSARLKKGEVLYLESRFCRYELCFSGEKVHANNGERMNIDSENNNVVDVFRWSRLKRPIPCTLMPIFGIPLPPEKVKVLEDELEWDNISWSQTGVWIAGREYHLSRTLFLSAN